METFLIRALQLILSLSILVLVHEFGHFIFARIFKVRVEKFYLFLRSLVLIVQIQAEEQRNGIWYRLAASRRLLQDIRYDRRKYGQGSDGTACQTV